MFLCFLLTTGSFVCMIVFHIVMVTICGENKVVEILCNITSRIRLFATSRSLQPHFVLRFSCRSIEEFGQKQTSSKVFDKELAEK